MKERRLSEELILSVVSNPQQVFPIGYGKKIYQSVVNFGDLDKPLIVRVVVNVLKSPFLVITAYRSSKIEKYWQNEGKIQ